MPARSSSTSRSSAARGRAKAGLSWTDATLAPVVLVMGGESLLAERAIDSLTSQARERDAAVEITRIDASAYTGGSLSYLTSPSLFGEARLIVADGVESLSEAFLADTLAYLDQPAEDVWLVLSHGGGARGRKLIDAIRSAGAPVVACDPIKRDSDKMDFVAGEFRRAGRRIDGHALRALVDAVGSDVRELAAACGQLVADTQGSVTAAVVDRYYGGRIEASGFRVADAAIEGRREEALALARHAVATGADPVVIVAALAAKARTLAKVAALRGRGADVAGELGMAPWLVDKARGELASWTPEGLAVAIRAIAQADAEVKGLGRDPVYAVERALLTVCAARGRD